MEPADAEPPTSWENLVCLAGFPNEELAHDHALVVLAMGEPCWIRENPDTSLSLYAEPSRHQEILAELSAYTREQTLAASTRAIPPPIESFHYPPGWGILTLWVCSLLAVFRLQSTDQSIADRFASSSIGLLGLHEWWRPFTALFLHSDVPHLLGNLISGALFGTLTSRSLGPVRGWALTLACGTAANTFTSLLNYPDPFLSLGASTAVFGALGILTGLGFAISLRYRSTATWARVAAPVLAGIILLAWLGGGTSNPNTDVLGHMLGFGSGLASGMLVGEIRQRAPRPDLLIAP